MQLQFLSSICHALTFCFAASTCHWPLAFFTIKNGFMVTKALLECWYVLTSFLPNFRGSHVSFVPTVPLWTLGSLVIYYSNNHHQSLCHDRTSESVSRVSKASFLLQNLSTKILCLQNLSSSKYFLYGSWNLVVLLQLSGTNLDREMGEVWARHTYRFM